MVHSVYEWLSGASVIVVVIVVWSPEVSSSCGKVDILNGPMNEHMQNDTHHAEIMHEFVKSSLYGCLEVCKGTNG